jgi:hypothetical protein
MTKSKVVSSIGTQIYTLIPSRAVTFETTRTDLYGATLNCQQRVNENKKLQEQDAT